MSIMKLTLIGCENALSKTDQSVFDLLDLPEGIDKDTVCDNIIMEGSDFEVLYGDPFFMRSCVGVWAKKHYRTFLKWITAMNLEYNPLENYDRIESWGDTGQDKRTLDHQDKRTLDTQDKRTLDTQDKRTLDTEDKRTLDTEDKRTLDTQDKQTRNISDETVYDKDTTTEHTVSAFDSSSYEPSSKDEMSEDGTVTINGTGTDTFDHTGTDTMDHSGTDTIDHSGTDTTDHSGTDTMDHSGTDTVDYSGTITDDKTNKHNGRIHGNVGVTTSQQMLQSEYDIARFNIVQQITDLFLSEFCILVYD